MNKKQEEEKEGKWVREITATLGRQSRKSASPSPDYQNPLALAPQAYQASASPRPLDWEPSPGRGHRASASCRPAPTRAYPVPSGGGSQTRPPCLSLQGSPTCLTAQG